jgi:valyl-tRNA synthetase
MEIGSPSKLEKPRLAASTVAGNAEVYVLLQHILDFSSESNRLKKEIGKLEKELTSTRKKLANEDFLQKAPQEVIQKEQEKSSRLSEKLEKVRHHYSRIAELRKSAAEERA